MSIENNNNNNQSLTWEKFMCNSFWLNKGVVVCAHLHENPQDIWEIIIPKSAQLKSLFILQIYEMFALQHFLLLFTTSSFAKQKKIFLLLLLLLLLLVLIFFFLFLSYMLVHRLMSRNAAKCEKLKYYRHYFIFDLETWRVLLWVVWRSMVFNSRTGLNVELLVWMLKV